MIVLGLSLGLPVTSTAAANYPADALALAPAPFSYTHEWLIYVALGLGGLNMILLYLLNRSPSRSAADSVTHSELGSSDAPSSSSSRTDKRMDKRKREIDELRNQVEELTVKLNIECTKRLTTAQVQELVRTFVHDELTRSALPGNTAG